MGRDDHRHRGSNLYLQSGCTYFNGIPLRPLSYRPLLARTVWRKHFYLALCPNHCPKESGFETIADFPPLAYTRTSSRFLRICDGNARKRYFSSAVQYQEATTHTFQASAIPHSDDRNTNHPQQPYLLTVHAGRVSAERRHARQHDASPSRYFEVHKTDLRRIGAILKVQTALVRGYFPREMPPVFSSKEFGEIASRLVSHAPVKEWTKPVAMNLARPGSLRRRLSIPNPFSQLALVNECHENWSELNAHLAKSQISLSRPTVKFGGKRSLEFRVPFTDRAHQRLQRMWRGRFTVRADITDCYGSVYTHSLDWALHTKAAAKANIRSSGPKLLGAKLDALVRNGQDGQTKGIPVGPDTSLLLAEIILSDIDSSLQHKMKQVSTSAIRMVDDIEFFAQSRGEAEDFLTAWDSLLHGYDLSLNPRKTEIVEGPIPPELPWRVYLSQFRFRTETDALLARDVQSFFARAFELSVENPGDSVLGYAVARAGALAVGDKSWAALQYAMLAAITVEPSTLRFVSPLLTKANSRGARIDMDLIEETLNRICSYHAPFEHGSEVAWSLHILKELQLPIDEEAAVRVAEMRDNCSLLLLMDFIERSSITGQIPDMTAVHARAEEEGADKSEDWLLGYEAGRNGWTNSSNYAAEPHWKELLEANVAFFKAGPDGKPAISASSSNPSPGSSSKNQQLTPPTPFPPFMNLGAGGNDSPFMNDSENEQEVDPSQFY